MSSCKCSNIFEPFKIRNPKEKNPPSLCQENNLTKEGKASPNQSFNFLEKYAGYNKSDYGPKKQIFISKLSKPQIQSGKSIDINKRRFSERSLDAQNTPHIQIHEIKNLDGNNLISMIGDGNLMGRFNNNDKFMEMFKNMPEKKKNINMEDIAP